MRITAILVLIFAKAASLPRGAVRCHTLFVQTSVQKAGLE